MNKFTQLVLWLGTIVGEENISDFENFWKDEMGYDVKYHSEFKLNNKNKNNCVLFYIASEDIPKFALFRITTTDLKWFEDYVENNPKEIPLDIMNLYSEYMGMEG